MNIFQTILMALKSILNNKMRTLLTMLGVIIGVSSVITLVSVFQGVQQKTMEAWFSTGTNLVQVNYWGEETDFSDVLTEFVYENLSEEIEIITPAIEANITPVYLDKVPSYCRASYTDETYIDMKGYEIAQGRNIAYGDVKSRTKVVVIGEYLRKEFFGGISNAVGQKIKIDGQDYTVVGVLEQKFDGTQWSEDNIAILPISTTIYSSNQNMNSGNVYLTAYDGDATMTAMNYINENFYTVFSDASGVYAYTNNEWIDNMNEQSRMMSLAIGAIGGISLLVGGIGIMNIMLVSVTERTREIGIRMSIGAKRKNIIIQFLIEAAAVSGFGGIIGILIGSFATVLIGSFIVQDIIYPSIEIIIGSFLFSVFLGIFFGFYPANKASKLNPIDALRTQ